MNQSARSTTRKSDNPEPAVPFLYQCDHCQTSFRSSGLLARHIGRAHGGQKKRYSVQEEYRDGSTKPFKCSKCGVVFSRQATLVGHIQRHMQESEKHTCAVCDREFGTVNELRAHVYEGHESQKVQKIHMIQAPSKKLYECKLCENKSFPKKSLLERHFLVHTKLKPFKCLICNKCFNQKSTLNTHLLIHSGIQNFTCMLCGLKFSQKINLRVHTLRMHPKRSVADRLPCPYCPCLFKKLGSLNAHKTKVHAELLPDPATTTSNEVESRLKDEPEVTGSMVVLKRTEDRVGIQSVVIPPSVSDPEVVQPVVASRTQLHLEGRSEERQHTCAICPAAFKKASHLTQHTRSHYGIKSNRCDICNRTFTTSHSLKVHRNSHNSTVPDYGCDQCPARFNLLSSLRRHVAIHENPDRSYSCPICKRNFKWFQNCKSHIRTSHAKELQEEKPPEPIMTTETTQQSNETVIDLPPNVQIYDINNCLIRIDEYYQFPVQIETDQLTQEMVEIAQDATTDQLYDLPDHEISQEEVLDQSNTPEPPNPKPEPINLPINPTEQDLFSEVLTNGKKCYVCRSCQKPFKKPIDLRRHIRTHTGERPFRCPQHQCGKTFTLKAVLQQHLKTHDERREVLLCPEADCRSKFTTKAALELHRRLHTGNRPFRCTVCTLKFRTSGHMQAHMDSHERLAVKREQNMLQFGA